MRPVDSCDIKRDFSSHSHSDYKHLLNLKKNLRKGKETFEEVQSNYGDFQPSYRAVSRWLNKIQRWKKTC